MDPDDNAAPSSKTRILPPTSGSVTAYDLWRIQKLRQDLRQEYLDYLAASAKYTGTGRPIDAIICPVAAYASPPHGKNTLESSLSCILSNRSFISSFSQECRLYLSMELARLSCSDFPGHYG